MVGLNTYAHNITFAASRDWDDNLGLPQLFSDSPGFPVAHPLLSERSMRTCDSVQTYFDRAADELELPPNQRELLISPRREVQLQMPCETDAGDLRCATGYRVQHNRTRGPMKGGLRIHPHVDLAEVRGLASLMTRKSAVVVSGRGLSNWKCNLHQFAGRRAAIGKLHLRGVRSCILDVGAADEPGHIP